MQIITSHLNLDFDGLASMIAAGKLYPKAKKVMPEKTGMAVQQFMSLYKDSVQLVKKEQVQWDKVQEIILVDTANLERIGSLQKSLPEKAKITVYDHHQPTEQNVVADIEKIEQVGAAVTLLVEEIMDKNIPISAFEATIMALGLYTDTGSLSYLSTTVRDLKVAAFLLEQGANLAIVSRFSDRPLLGEQQDLFNTLLTNSKEYNHRGIDILMAWHSQNKYQGSLALLARKMLEVTGVHGLFLVVEMAGKTFVVARSNSHLLDVHHVMAELGGGGHAKAASATIKGGNYQEIVAWLEGQMAQLVKPSVTARDIMSFPVKTVSSNMEIKEVAKVLLRYGHTGLPVVTDGQLVGIISRRDVEKANHHGLGHAPVKGYMSKKVLTIAPNATLEEIQNMLIENNVGRLPVLGDGKLVGIVSRTDVLNYMHGENIKGELFDTMLSVPVEKDVTGLIEQLLKTETRQLLGKIGKKADSYNYQVFLIGGIVRDLLIGQPSEDIDLVVEGDGIYFAEQLGKAFGGKVVIHEKFGTATWVIPNGLKIDVTTARKEYYDYPAAMPKVERSNLKEDLFRRDFTINAMAIQLNGAKAGYLIDHFHGCQDLAKQVIRILYNLSFVEDPTRILRAVRFEHRLGFRMESQTEELALNSADLITSVSELRLGTEFKLLFNEKNPLWAMERLDYFSIWDYLIGDGLVSQVNMDIANNLEKLAEQVGLERRRSSIWLCHLGAMYWGKSDWSEQVGLFTLNKLENKIVQEMAQLTSEWTRLWAYGKPDLGQLHQHLKHYSVEAVLFITAVQTMQWQQLLVEYLQKRDHIQLPLVGEDLKKLGIKPGPIYTTIFDELEKLIFNKIITTKEDALEWVVKVYGQN